MRTYIRLISLAVFVLFGAALPAGAGKSIGVPRATPSAIFAAESAVVTITAPVAAAPDSQPMSTDLIRVNEQGKSIRTLGRLYDDGTHGDALASDNIFTGQFSFNERNPTGIHLVVTAAYRGKLLRTRSPVFTLDVRRRSASIGQQPTMQEQPNIAQTCETLHSQIGLNTACTAIASCLNQPLAIKDGETWLTMFVPSLVAVQNNC